MPLPPSVAGAFGLGSAVGTGGAGIASIERPHIPQNRLSTEFSAPHDAHRKMFSLIAVHSDGFTAAGSRIHVRKIDPILPTLAKISGLAPVSLVAVPSGVRATTLGEKPLISTKIAEHYLWGAGCDGLHLVKSDALSVIQERIPPGGSEVRHFHVVSRQFFFVLSGALSIELQGRVETLHPDEGLEIPPGQPHRVFNANSADAHFLVISQPPSHGDRVLAKEDSPAEHFS